MKRILIATILGFVSFPVFSRGQGQVIFCNYLSSTTAAQVVWDGSFFGHTAAQPVEAREGLQAELWYGLGANLDLWLLRPIWSSSTLVGAYGPGVFNGGVVKMPDLEPGEPVTFCITVSGGPLLYGSIPLYSSYEWITWTEPASTIVPVGMPPNFFTPELLAAAYPNGIRVSVAIPEPGWAALFSLWLVGLLKHSNRSRLDQAKAIRRDGKAILFKDTQPQIFNSAGL